MWPILTLLAFAAAIGCAWLWQRTRARRFEAEHALAAKIEELRAAEENHRAAMAESEVQRASLFNSMSEGLLVLDTQDRIQLVNGAFVKLFAIHGDLRGHTVLEAVRLLDLQDIIGRVKTVGQVLGHEIELPGIRPRWLQVNATQLLNGGGRPRGIIMVFHDLTHLKQVEKARKEFVANVSHELRTPLSLIKGYVETLIDGAKDDPVVALRFLQTVEKHADRLTYLIEDLLTLSRLESGTIALNLQTVGVRDLVARVTEDLAARAKARNVKMQNTVPAELRAEADANRVQQVLFNLVDNAIKYGRARGEIVVGGQTGNGRFVEVWVQDDGPGIPAESLGRIFERFYRVDKGRSREQGGTGLGLAIVKHIVQCHGGEARVESEVGHGAKFCFTLPTPTQQEA